MIVVALLGVVLAGMASLGFRLRRVEAELRRLRPR